jgi:hypothetical protein
MLQELYGGGFASRETPVSREDVADTIEKINHHFGLSLRLTDEAYQLLSSRLPAVAGAFEGDTPPVSRKQLKARLTRLTSSLEAAIRVLKPVRPMRQEEEGELEFSLFLLKVIADAQGHSTGHEARSQMQVLLSELEQLLGYCEQAAGRLEKIRTRAGRRPLDFYDGFVDVVRAFASRIGMEVISASAWDSGAEEKATAFTFLVFEIERLLPRTAWSNSLTSCAARTKSSLSRLQSSEKNSARR